MGNTANYSWPYPASTDVPDVPADMKDLADAADASVKTLDDTVTANAALPTFIDYTPTWFTSGTQPSIGNGILRGRWGRVGNMLFLRIQMKIGSTTNLGTNGWNFGLPAGLTGYADADFSPRPPAVGQAISRDESANAYFTAVAFVNLDGLSVGLVGTTTSGPTYSSTVPIAWASTDQMALDAQIELT